VLLAEGGDTIDYIGEYLGADFEACGWEGLARSAERAKKGMVEV